MNKQKRRSDLAGRAPLPSPGRPPVAGREERGRFWADCRGLIERGTMPKPTSSIILSASTIRNAGTRRSDI